MTNTDTSAAVNPVLRTSADPAVAEAHFAARLSLYTDPSDVHAAMAEGAPGFTVVDVRNREAWDHGHVPGAVHIPYAQAAELAPGLIDRATPVVVYCWSPACDGGARGALAFARLGYRVKEMIGGIEYWTREGFPTETAAGVDRRPADPLVAPAGVSCAC
ncbi:rhodanese-like domain-containing protein [Nocardiopsis chromatogenes]|uniref:rhodanese-like domain-containing protein n=1 Tax=Nocardiopsis chromatogenes TaxID=280239 RepID=UPI0004763BBB|nr:rhodanese-like domain-containing protein [Nocardiopsis chromatogenes]